MYQNVALFYRTACLASEHTPYTVFIIAKEAATAALIIIFILHRLHLITIVCGQDVVSLPINRLSTDLCMALQSDRLSMAALFHASVLRTRQHLPNLPMHLSNIHVMNMLCIDGIGISSVSFDHEAPIIWRLPF